MWMRGSWRGLGGSGWIRRAGVCCMSMSMYMYICNVGSTM
jgi:hypothetical protein